MEIKKENKPRSSQNISKQQQAKPVAGFAFGRENYILLLVSIALIILGYILMVGGGSNDPNVFSEEVFSTRRITVGPMTALAGFMFGIYAILKKPKE